MRYFTKLLVIWKLSRMTSSLQCFLILISGKSSGVQEHTVLHSATSKEPNHFWHLPNQWYFWKMTHLKSEGHRTYILKIPRYIDLPEKGPNVIFSQTPLVGPCRAIPLEQLTKEASGRNCSMGMELRVGSSWLGTKLPQPKLFLQITLWK